MENGKYTRMVECMSKEQQISITNSYICLQKLKEIKEKSIYGHGSEKEIKELKKGLNNAD